MSFQVECLVHSGALAVRYLLTIVLKNSYFLVKTVVSCFVFKTRFCLCIWDSSPFENPPFKGNSFVIFSTHRTSNSKIDGAFLLGFHVYKLG